MILNAVSKLPLLKFKLLDELYNWAGRQSNHRWYNWPFGRELLADKPTYIKLSADSRLKIYPEVDQFESEMGYSVDVEWLHELALHTQIVIKDSELCYQHGRILYSALSKYLELKPRDDPAERLTIWETGTARGFSALCMAKALSDQQRAGMILTFDILPHETKMYWNCVDDHDGPQDKG